MKKIADTIKLDNNRKATSIGSDPVLYHLRKIRKEANMSQDEVAGRLNISRQYYSQIERGLNTLSYNDARSLARIFHTTCEELFDEDFKNQKKYGHY